MIGEICIRHGIKGEGCFFIQEQFDKDFIFDYVLDLLKKKEIASPDLVTVELNEVIIQRQQFETTKLEPGLADEIQVIGGLALARLKIAQGEVAELSGLVDLITKR